MTAKEPLYRIGYIYITKYFREVNNRMKPPIKTKTLMLGLCLSLLSPIVVADSFKASEVEDLRKQGKAKQAYELALKYRNDLEGDAAYDFAYGMAAIDAGKLSEGVLALERVALTTPKNTLARLELARAYFLLKEDTRARQEFKIVLARNPPAGVVTNIKKFLRIIRLRESEYRSTGSAYIDVALGYDTNINSAPADATFFSPILGTLSLAGSALKNSDEFLKITTGGKLLHPFEPGKQLILGVDVSARFNADDDLFETENWNIYAGVKWRKGKDRFGINAQVQEFELADLDNRSLVSLSGSWTRHLNKQTSWATQFQVAQIGFPGQNIRDSTLYVLGTGLTHQYAMKWRPTISGSVYLGKEIAATDSEIARSSAQRNYGGIRVAAQIIPTSRMSISASVSAETSHYQGENILTGKTRNDQLYQASVTGRYIIDDNWSLGAGVFYTRNDSNTVLTDYDKTVTQVSARYTF